MKLLKFILPLAVAIQGFSTLRADDRAFSTTNEAKERDMQAIQDYINTKRAVSVDEKGGDLRISGDIRTEYSHYYARTDGIKQRGYSSRKLYPNTLIMNGFPKLSHKEYEKLDRAGKLAYRKAWSELKAPYPSNDFTIEANLMFDYITDDTWGSLKLQLANPGGISEFDRKVYLNDSKRMLFGSGKQSNIALRKAFVGYNVWEEGTSRFDVELGRRRLYDAFDSKIQYNSFFDGLLGHFATSIDGLTDFHFKAAAFVVDYTVNHYGYIGEASCLNIVDSGFDLKYSLIHWDRKAPNRAWKHHALGNRFINSQITAAYNISPDLVRQKTQLYGAYVVNHDAKANSWTHGHKANKAFYVGCTYGVVQRKGDYAVDVAYQMAQAQAISERDTSSLYRDNPRAISFYDRRSGGSANYKGYKVDAFYALTDNWTINAYYQDIRQASRKIGGKHHSNEFTLATIYAF